MRLFGIIVYLLSAATALAVSPQTWKIDSADEFLSGEIEGFIVTSNGSLSGAPAITKIASVTDPFVLSQVADGKGHRFLGTGNEGKVYRLEGSTLKLLYTAPEPEIYALAFRDDTLYVASSPNGKIYKVHPASGAATVFFDPRQAYIWALAFLQDGNLAAATGLEGKLFRVDPSGKGSIWFDAGESHLRSLAPFGDGKLLVGGSGEGRIYEVSSAGGRSLYDSQFSEISAIYFDSKRGIGWAAGVTNVLPSTAPPRTDPSRKPSSPAGQPVSPEKPADGQASGGVDVSFSFDDASSQGTAAASGSAEIYRIDRDGYVEPVRKLDREIVYAITADNSGGLYLASGPQGRVYRLSERAEVSLIAALPEKQVVSFSNEASGIFATTTNSGAIYRIEQGLAGKAEYRSTVKDTGRFSRFGQYLIEGKGVSGGRVQVSFRSGNTSAPDNTWSDWSAPLKSAEGAINTPPARYVQCRVSSAAPSSDLLVTSMSIAFVNRNVAPVIESMIVLEPAVVFLAGNYPPPPQVVEATNPDESGIFTTLEEPADRGAQGKKYFRRGYRTVTWKASDPNSDTLRYSLFFRRQGSLPWLRMRENLEETQFNFDTSQLPDGMYELRLTATDSMSNVGHPLTDAKESVELLVDNSKPSVVTSRAGGKIVIRIQDVLSPITKAEYSVDAQKWMPLLPDDGILDSRAETFSLEEKAVAGDRKFIVVRAVDAFYNVTTEPLALN